jgi:hypothetical protein
MAALQHNAGESSDSSNTIDAKRSGVASERVDLPLFRFGLRQLFWFVAVVSTLLTAIVLSHGVTALALVLAALVVAAHVFSTALGSRLRWHANQARASSLEPGPTTGSTAAHTQLHGASAVPLTSSAAQSTWHVRGGASLPWLPTLIIAGVLTGGFAGSVLLTMTIGHRTSPAGILVGGVSLAVLGGWLAFLGGSFYGIVRHGVREAVSEHRNDEARRRAAP